MRRVHRWQVLHHQHPVEGSGGDICDQSISRRLLCFSFFSVIIIIIIIMLVFPRREILVEKRPALLLRLLAGEVRCGRRGHVHALPVQQVPAPVGAGHLRGGGQLRCRYVPLKPLRHVMPQVRGRPVLSPAWGHAVQRLRVLPRRPVLQCGGRQRVQGLQARLVPEPPRAPPVLRLPAGHRRHERDGRNRQDRYVQGVWHGQVPRPSRHAGMQGMSQVLKSVNIVSQVSHFIKPLLSLSHLDSLSGSDKSFSLSLSLPPPSSRCVSLFVSLSTSAFLVAIVSSFLS